MTKLYRNIFFYLILYLVLIIALGVVLRFYTLDRADVLGDETSYAFRSIGYFDWLASPAQTTPMEWLDYRPSWTYLSFHDHPFFGFFLQFLQFKITGISIWAMRFWPALYGVLSIGLLYLITKKLFTKATAILAAAILAVNNLHVWVSRLGLQESLVILLSLLSVWLFLQALSNKKYFYWLGLSVGLALATKLTAIIIWPILLLYLLIFKREYFRFKELYLSLIISFILTIPYIIYNLFLYNNFGHFDFQISHILKQQVEAWQIRPGRAEVPSKIYAFSFIFQGFQKALSPVSLYLFLAGLLSGLVYFIKNKFKNIDPAYYLLAIIIVWHIALYVFIGAGVRFLAMLVPWLAIVLALLICRLVKIHYLIWIVPIIFLGWQVFFTYQSNISYSPIWQSGTSYSELKSQVHDYGYNKLSFYLDELLASKKPAVTLQAVNQNIQKVMEQGAKKQTGSPESLLIVFDSRMYGQAILWSFTRHFLYEGWPVLSLDSYLKAIEHNGENIFSQLGVKDIYYVSITSNTLIEDDYQPHSSSDEDKQIVFEQKLKNMGEIMKTIHNSEGQVVFNVYKF